MHPHMASHDIRFFVVNQDDFETIIGNIDLTAYDVIPDPKLYDPSFAWLNVAVPLRIVFRREPEHLAISEPGLSLNASIPVEKTALPSTCSVSPSVRRPRVVELPCA